MCKNTKFTKGYIMRKLFDNYCTNDIYKYCIGFIAGVVFCAIKTYYTNDNFANCLEASLKALIQ